ncbi:hypothetical protein RA955_11080 [Geobacillus proteiniphilus]|uniref:Mobile element protein n=1 Tax=Geobacillus proteiniphilus TaxID=860353 RepID=A0ABY9MBJ4_9BACL|nr:hypothetical protein [Geobacillus proteiniphilus]WMJ15355.1 hypothetical protein RA955_11080 [Geobacillus proteiniphilus]
MEKQMKAWIQTIRQLFSPEELTRLARKTGFIRRQRSLTAEAFLTLCAWGDGSLAKQSLQRLCAALTLWHGCSLSSEGLNQRFTDRAVAFLREVFSFSSCINVHCFCQPWRPIELVLPACGFWTQPAFWFPLTMGKTIEVPFRRG